MNIFNSLPVYAGKWSVKASRNFSDEEKAAIVNAETVSSQYGISVCFTLVGGGQTYIPLSQNSQLGVGEAVDMDAAKLLTLEKRGEDDILRVEI